MLTQLHISRLLLLVFMMTQLSVLHELQHDDSDHCDICLIAHKIQSTAFDVQPVMVVSIKTPIPLIVINNYSYLAFAKANTASSILSIRPPPTV